MEGGQIVEFRVKGVEQKREQESVNDNEAGDIVSSTHAMTAPSSGDKTSRPAVAVGSAAGAGDKSINCCDVVWISSSPSFPG